MSPAYNQTLAAPKADPLNALTPPPSEGHDPGDTHSLGPTSDKPIVLETPPPNYRDREAKWYTSGRLFKIWALEDAEIHQKEFVLVSSRNKEGQGLLIRTYDKEDEQDGSFLRAHVLIREPISDEPKFSSEEGVSQRLQQVHLDDFEEGHIEVAEHTWVELEHTYNIPFLNHKCVDCGTLSRPSLKKLRLAYVNFLRYDWDLD